MIERIRMIALLATVVVALAAAACKGEAAPSEVVHTGEYALAAGAQITVLGENTSVKVRKAVGNVFKITATVKGAGDVAYYVLPKTDAPIADLLVNSRLKPDAKGGSSVEMTLEVPDGSKLSIDSTNGALEMDGVALNESNLLTTNSPVTVRGSQGDFTVNTSNGALTITGSSGTWWTQTTNAAVVFDGALFGTRTNRFKTVGGDISVRLTGAPDLTFNVRASGGTVTATETSSQRESEGVTVARYGEGTGTVEVEVTGGNVSIGRTGG